MTTPPLDLTALTEIANAATEGPWTWNSTPVDTVSGEGGESCIDAGTIGVTGDVYTDEDANFIETFDPPTVLALLDRVEELQRNWMQECGNYEAALNRAEAAEKKVAKVRELHTKRTFTAGDYSHDYCDHCGTWDEPNYIYPCPTITALDGTA